MEKRKARLAKGISISVLALVVGAFALNGWALNPKDKQDEVVVTVNDVTITRDEVNKKIAAMLGPRAETLSPEKLAEIRDRLSQRVLDSLIVDILLTKAVETEHVAVKDADINKVLTQLKGSLPSNVTFEDYLKRIGLTEKDLRQTVAKNLGIQQLVEQQTKDVTAPDEAEIEAYYKDHPDQFQVPERVDVRHILVAVGPDDKEEAKVEKKKKAEEIRKELVDKKGENFETVAAEASDCPSKAKGGKLGLIGRGQTVKPFEEAAFTQKVGEIGPVVETQFGYHIIEVLDRKEAGKVPLSEVKEDIARHLTEQKKEQAVHAYIDSLKAAATIVFPNETTDTKNPA
ncbi:MAG: peptidylprolyl isomerase [Deltaproteobacteria bacterium]|nr:peptidylprolyl isomerase [Deltaproteobacteria bacterium]